MSTVDLHCEYPPSACNWLVRQRYSADRHAPAIPQVTGGRFTMACRQRRSRHRYAQACGRPVDRLPSLLTGDIGAPLLPRSNQSPTRHPAGSPKCESDGASKKGLRGDEGREAILFFERHCRRPAQDYGHTHGVSGVSPSRSFTGWAWRASGSSPTRYGCQYPTCSPPSDRNVSSRPLQRGGMGGPYERRKGRGLDRSASLLSSSGLSRGPSSRLVLRSRCSLHRGSSA